MVIEVMARGLVIAPPAILNNRPENLPAGALTTPIIHNHQSRPFPTNRRATRGHLGITHTAAAPRPSPAAAYGAARHHHADEPGAMPSSSPNTRLRGGQDTRGQTDLGCPPLAASGVPQLGGGETYAVKPRRHVKDAHALSNDFSRSLYDHLLLVLRNVPGLPIGVSFASNCPAPYQVWGTSQEHRFLAYAKCLHWDSDTSVLTGFKGWILWPSPEQFVVGIQIVAFVPPSASTIQPSIHWFECACQIRHKAINQIRLVPPYTSHAYWSRWQYWTSYPHRLGCSSGKGTTTQHCPWILPPNAYCRLMRESLKMLLRLMWFLAKVFPSKGLKASLLRSTVTRVHNSHRPSRWYSIPLQPLVPMQRRLHSSKTSPPFRLRVVS